MNQISLNDYKDLKKKYEDLLKENEKLKAKIKRLESADLQYKSKEILSGKKQVEPGTTFEEGFFNVKPVNHCSQNHEKIILFKSLFRERSDVYVKKWHNKKGISGYSPVCTNEWNHLY